ncbi:MAG: XRE family transcriptional regulator [Patescibacteria group bacterium]|nr:MAG: XRE family transcriptional regulator [Patescibacteria group bacterium]
MRGKAAINPKILVWAREDFGISIEAVAKGIGQKNKKIIELWEKGEDAPSFAQLESLARFYKRPTAFFYLPEPPTPTKLPNDFRTALSKNVEILHKETRLAVRRAEYVQQVLKEIEQEGLEEFKLKTTLADDSNLLVREVEILGNLDREHFRKSTQDSRTALAFWRNFIEEKIGVITLSLPFPLKEARGFSLFDATHPVVVINSHDTENGKIFSLFHELGHLALRGSGICLPSEVGTSNSFPSKIEQFCNSFAGSFLVPNNSLNNYKQKKSFDVENFDSTIDSTAKYFRVSKFVILARLLQLHEINKNIFSEKTQQYREEYEKIKNLVEKKKFAVKQEYLCVSANGPRFTTKVLASYNEKKITLSDVSRLLNVGVRHIKNVESYIYKRARNT